MKNHYKIQSLSELQKHLDNPESTLIIFDIDYVLTHPKEPAYQVPNFEKNISFVRSLFTSLSPLERDIFSNLINIDSFTLVEKSSPNFITHCQKKGYKAIALTAALTSDLNGCNVKKRKQEILHSFGIDFSKAFPEHAEITFDSFVSNRGTYPAFYKGILFSNGENKANQKAPVLKEFLKNTSFRPAKILFVDDRKPNLVAIQNEFDSQDIEIFTFHYQGSFIYPSKIIESDELESKWKMLANRAKEIALEAQSLTQNDG